MNKLLNIEKQSFNPINWRIENFQKLLPNKNRLSFLAYSEACLIGFLVGSSYFLNQNITSHVNRIAVDMNYRGLGVGNGLLSDFEIASKNLGISACTLETSNSEIVNEFYVQNGYKIVLDKQLLTEYLSSKSKSHKINDFHKSESLLYMKVL